MSEYKVLLTKQAEKDLKKLKQAGLAKKAKALIDIIKENPLQTPPQYEALVGILKGKYSRRINYQHRLVYKVLREQRTIVISSMWPHYEKER